MKTRCFDIPSSLLLETAPRAPVGLPPFLSAFLTSNPCEVACPEPGEKVVATTTKG